eukprot:Skav226969  [mRNA]  locus=scaffold51:343956:344586:- [translate_table: standard]
MLVLESMRHDNSATDAPCAVWGPPWDPSEINSLLQDAAPDIAHGLGELLGSAATAGQGAGAVVAVGNFVVP